MADDDGGYEVVKNYRAKSDVWRHFGLKKRKKDGKIIESLAICRSCDAHVKCAGGGTSNLVAHIRRHHPVHPAMLSVGVTKTKVGVVQHVDRKIEFSCTNSSKTEATPLTQVTPARPIVDMLQGLKKYPSISTRANRITQKITRFIVKDLRPYRIVESKEFSDVIKELDPRYTLPSRKQFSEVFVPEMYNTVRQDVITKISSANQVALTSDGWTSRSTDSYVTVTATLISTEWELLNFVLQTRTMPENHTAENIAEVIKEAVKEWKVPTNLGLPPLVSDNASNMIKAGKLLECVHIGCFAHTLNLAAQKALKLKSVSNALARVRAIVAYFHRSAVATTILKMKAELLNLPNHKLKIDVCTRWNSAFVMIERFLEVQPAIVAALRSKELFHVKNKEVNSLSDENLILLEDVASCLRPLYDVTTMLCSEKCPTVSVIMPLHHQLTNVIFVAKEDDCATVAEMKHIMKTDLDERYQEKKDFLNLTSALDPRFKLLPYLSEEDKSKVYLSLTQEAVRVHSALPLPQCKIKTEPTDNIINDTPPLPSLPTFALSEIKESSPPLLSTAVEVQQEIEILPASSSCVLGSLLGDIYVTKVEPAKSIQELAQLEVIQYKAELSISLQACPLSWWKKNQDRFPIIAKLAKSLLCVPATSVPSERVFSTAGDILTAQRASLKGKHVDMLIFLKKNME